MTARPQRGRHCGALLLLGSLLALGGCPSADGEAPADPGGVSPAEREPAEDGAVPGEVPPAEAPIKLLNPPAAEVEPELRGPEDVVRRAQVLLAQGDRERLARLLRPTEAAEAMPLEALRRRLGTAPPARSTVAGRRAVVGLGRGDSGGVVVLLERDGAWAIDLQLTATWAEVEPGPSIRANRPVGLAAAVAGVEGGGEGEGDLVAILATDSGELRCRLFEHRAPETVANFVALARGLRGFLDPKSGAWVRRPFYDGLLFHRVVPGRLIQGGDPRGDGRGGPGYAIADELDPTLRHDRAGTLSMANRGPNTGGSQFFITLGPMPELDDRHAVFGVCEPVEVVAAIAAADAGVDERPREPVRITSVTIARRPR